MSWLVTLLTFCARRVDVSLATVPHPRGPIGWLMRRR
jgi:hypothetical protein